METEKAQGIPEAADSKAAKEPIIVYYYQLFWDDTNGHCVRLYDKGNDFIYLARINVDTTEELHAFGKILERKHMLVTFDSDSQNLTLHLLKEGPGVKPRPIQS